MKIRRFVIFVFLSAFFPGCAYFNTFYNAKKNYQEAFKVTEKSKTSTLSGDERNKYQKSVDKALLILEDYPGSKWADDALLLLGKSYFFLQDYSTSERRLNELITGWPSGEFVNEARFWLAKNKVATRRFEEAENDLVRLTSQKISKKQKGEIIFFQARFYENKKEFEKAVETYRQVLKTDEKTWGARVWFAIGDDSDSLGAYDRSADAYKQVLRYSPDPDMEFESQFRYARARKNMDRFDEAVQALEKLQRNERNRLKIPLLRLETADCLVRKGDMAGAMLTYQDVIQANPGTDASAEAYYRMGGLFETERMEYDKALDHFSRVRKESGRSVYADSADIKGRDILRLNALNHVIGMALRGEKGKGVDVGSMAQEDTTGAADHDSLSQNTAVQFDSTAIDTLGLKKSKQPLAENPELKSFNKEELDKNLSLLGELYLFRFHVPDSALVQYRLLADRFPASPYAPQALYNLGHLYISIRNDSVRADSCFRVLVAGHPDSPHARGVRKRLGMGRAFSVEDSAWSAFSRAENSFWDDGNPGRAVEQYIDVWKRYPKAGAAPKALYSAGWMYEKALDAPAKALAAYDTLITRFPDSPFAVRVKMKVDAVKTAKSKPARTETSDIIKPVKTESVSADSLKKGAGSDSLKISLPPEFPPAGVAVPDTTRPFHPPDSGGRSERLD